MEGGIALINDYQSVRPGFGFGRPGFGIGLGFLGGLAAGALLAPGPGFGYYYPPYPYYLPYPP
ncbi:spore coat protein [Peribacillus frigoritolerans]|uniref:spore coat protein n=1 Tax=Peribacillus frigoritolerans TaxID=450367 RepID=UPI00359C32BB